VKIDGAGIPVPDDTPEVCDAITHLHRCPGCGASTWPGTDRDGKPYARTCVPCTIRDEETT
jgi:hypothetical protein